MKRTQYIALALALLLLAGYAAVTPSILQAKVGRAYRAYFIAHTAVGWHTFSYDVPESDGIDFTRAGKPLWVRAFGGLSEPSPLGTWTDARKSQGASIRYRVPFEGQVCVKLLASPSLDNLGGVSYLQMGTESRAFTTPSLAPAWHEFDILLEQPIDLVRVFPGVTERLSARDARIVGLLLQRLIVTPGRCA